MLPRKVQIKLYAKDSTDAPIDSYITVFHRFIQENALEDLLIDVADYGHVPQGPGVLLVGHAGDYSLDEGEGRPGLCYLRKRDLPEGSNLVLDGLSKTLRAAELLEQREEVKGPKGFSTDEILLRFPDRLAVQNDEEGFSEVRDMIHKALSEAFPEKKYSLSREGEAREPLTVRAVC